MSDVTFDMESKASELYATMLQANNPAPINTKLNKLEAKLGRERLLSYPQYLTLPLTNICNAHCIFCHYTEKKNKTIVTPEDLSKLSWLRFVEKINVNGGYGDSLVNPHFGDILNYIHELAPGSNLSMTTNGIGLTERLIPQICGRMSSLLVSLNAPDPENWARVMQRPSAGGTFNKIVGLIKEICRQKQPNLNIGLSMVVFKDNLHLVENFIHLAHEIGVDTVILAHYYPVSFHGNKKLQSEQSLYYCKKETDSIFCIADKISDSYGITLSRPKLFADGPDKCNSLCYQPFNQCILTNCAMDSGNDVTPCCVGYRFGLDWNYNLLDDKYFMNEIWNNAVFRFLRKAQYDKKVDNAYCRACLGQDRFDPRRTKDFLAASAHMSDYSRKLVEENPEEF